MHVVRLFEQARLHFAEIGFHIRLPQSKHPKSDWFYNAEVALQALGNSRILHLDRVFTSPVSSPMHLADRGAVGGFLFEMLEDFLRPLGKLAAEGFSHQRIGERWNRRLGLCKLLCIRGWEQVLVDAEHLGKLERASLEFAECVVDHRRVFFVKLLQEFALPRGVLAGNHGASVVSQVIHPDPCTRPSECGHAADGPGADLFLLGPLWLGCGLRRPLAVWFLLHEVTFPLPSACTRDFREAETATNRPPSRAPASGTDRRRA